MFHHGSLGKRSEGKVKKKRKVRRKRRLRTPAPVHGRKHMETQTSRYLEEIHVHPSENTICTQTDPMLDYPEPPLFVPQTSGISVATQIEDGDLFDFNVEVIPLLETLVGKALDMAMMEACEEQELKALRQHQEMYEQRRNAELTECQRLQELERRLFEERERRKQQARRYQEQKKKEERQIAAKLLVKEKQQDLKEITFARLQEKGVFGEEPLLKFISNTMMQEIYEQVGELLKPKKISVEIVNALIEHVVKSLLEKKMNSTNEIKKEFEDRKQKEAQLLGLWADFNQRVEIVAALLNSIREEDFFTFEVSALLKEDAENLVEFVESLKDGVSSKKLLAKLQIEGSEVESLTSRIEELSQYEELYAMRCEARKVVKILETLEEEALAPALAEFGVDSKDSFHSKFVVKESESTQDSLKELSEFVSKHQAEETNNEEVEVEG